MLRITLTKDEMFEIIQVLDVQEVLGNYFLPLPSHVIHDSKRESGSIHLGLYT